MLPCGWDLFVCCVVGCFFVFDCCLCYCCLIVILLMINEVRGLVLV